MSQPRTYALALGLSLGLQAHAAPTDPPTDKVPPVDPAVTDPAATDPAATDPAVVDPSVDDVAPIPDAPKLTLHEALLMAIRQNPTLASVGVDVAITEARMVAASAVDDYVLTANANWLSTRSEPVQGQFFQQLAMDRIDLGGGITKMLPDGGRVGVHISHEFLRTVSQLQVMGASMDQTVTTFSPALTVSFFQPLLRNFGDEAAHAETLRAEAAKDVAVLERENTASTVVSAVIQAYWELAFAQEEVTIREGALTLAREQLRITQARVDAEVAAPADLSAVEQGIASREEELLLSQQALSQRAVELRILIGLELDPRQLHVVAVDRPSLASHELPDPEEEVAKAMEHNPQIAILDARGEQAQLEVVLIDNATLPQLDFTASAGPTGNSADFVDAMGQLVTFDSFSVQAGLIFAMPFGDDVRDGSIGIAEGGVRKIKIGQEELKAQVSVAVVRAVDLVESAQKRLDVLAKSTALAQTNLEAEQARFEVGAATNFDILRRQEELQQSQLRQARAEIDYQKALTILQGLTGELLPEYGIVLDASFVAD